MIVINLIAIKFMLSLTFYAKFRAFNITAKRTECQLIVTQFTTLTIQVENLFSERNLEE
jgi:hypothetical protein